MEVAPDLENNLYVFQKHGVGPGVMTSLQMGRAVLLTLERREEEIDVPLHVFMDEVRAVGSFLRRFDIVLEIEKRSPIVLCRRPVFCFYGTDFFLS